MNSRYKMDKSLRNNKEKVTPVLRAWVRQQFQKAIKQIVNLKYVFNYVGTKLLYFLD